MKQKIKDMLLSSFFIRWGNRASARVSGFLRSSAIAAWFCGEKEERRAIDRLLSRLIDGKFCEFLRSSVLLGLLMKIPGLAWISLLVTVIGATFLPTLIVMILSLMTLALTVIGVVFRKETLPPLPNAVVFWAVYAGITLIYTFIGYGGSQGMLAGGIRFCMLPVMPCAFVLLSKGDRMWKSVCVLTGAALPVGLYGLFQFVTGQMSAKWTDTALFSEDFGRLTATFENPNIYGAFLLIALPVAVAVTMRVKGWRGKVFFGGTALVLAANMVLTYSRGCYVALLVILAVCLCRKDIRWAIPMVLAAAASPLYLPQSVMARFQSIGNMSDTSTSYRLNIWRGSMAMLGDFWWVGVGIGDVAFRSIYEKYALSTVEDAPHAHNLILQTMCETGILGLAALVLAFVFCFRRAYSVQKTMPAGRERTISLVWCAVWLGLLFQGMTDFIFYNNNLFCIMMFSLGAMIVKGEKNE